MQRLSKTVLAMSNPIVDPLDNEEEEDGEEEEDDVGVERTPINTPSSS